MFTDRGVGCDYGGGCDGGDVCDRCRWGDDGCWMNALGLLSTAKELGGAGEVELGVGAEEGWFGGRGLVGEVFGQDDGGCIRLESGLLAEGLSVAKNDAPRLGR